MKVALDTSVVNWLADHPTEAAEFFAAREKGLFETIVPYEVSVEIRRTKDAERLAVLEATLAHFFPLTPTRVPRVGAFRLGMARISLPEDTARLAATGFLRDGQDRNIAANAGGYRADVFLTRDYEMSRDKREALEAALGCPRVLEPEVFVRELRTLRRDTPGDEGQ